MYANESDNLTNGMLLLSSILIFSVIALFYFVDNTQRPRLYFIESSENKSRIARCNALKSYSPTIWLSFDWHGNFQTVLFFFWRKFYYPVNIPVSRELLVLPDGGTVGLDWFEGPNLAGSPVAILHHGLGGSTKSVYIQHIASHLLKRGYKVVSYVARGCGGVPLTTFDTFTAARTLDINCVIEHVKRLYPDRPLIGIGYSLGAGIMLKYIGEKGKDCPLKSAICISPSWNYHEMSSFFWFWNRYRLLGELLFQRKYTLSFKYTCPFFFALITLFLCPPAQRI